MKNSSIILAAGAVVAMASTSAMGARLDSTYTKSDIKEAGSSNVNPGTARVGTVYNFDVTGIESVDGLGSAGNTVIAFDLAAALGFASGTPLTMNGIAWDVTLTAGVGSNTGSWLSEMVVYFDDNIAPDQSGLFLTPGINDSFPGQGTYSDPGIKLADVGIPDIALPDGVLRLEFFESFDDGPGVEGIWKSGFLAIQVAEVPAPGAAALLGLGGLAMSRRRR
ncbi:MAG: hypothetical protein H6813_04800 [Phycisphaeraceae bacterium]|nr:hypothetical protein [Phycisphaeraceae bacterium]